jgi:hypothetical protein
MEHNNSVPIAAEAEVVVLGAGPAGIAAAVAAAKNGARTILVERYGFLGGGGTTVGASAFDGLHANVHGDIRQVVHGVVDEVLERIDGLDGLNPPHLVQGRIYAQSYDMSAWKIAADEVVLSAGVEIRLHSLAVDAIVLHGKIDTLVLETKSGRRAIRGRVFVDCSGDADLAHWSGAACEKGDEKGFLQPAAMLFRLAGVDDARAVESLPRVPEIMAEAKRRGEFDLPRIGNVLRRLKHAGEWRANLTKVTRPSGTIDGTDVDDLTYGEIEGRRQVRLYWEFLRAKVPGFEKAYIVDVGPELGIRETRRVVGKYRLLTDDIIEARSFPDAVGVSGWPVEKHTPTGIEWKFPKGRGYHQLPYRCMQSPTIKNLLVAGRCIATEPDAQAAIRVSGPCFVTGQGAGTAAALAVRHTQDLDSIDASELHRALERDGVFLGEEEQASS